MTKVSKHGLSYQSITGSRNATEVFPAEGHEWTLPEATGERAAGARHPQLKNRKSQRCMYIIAISKTENLNDVILKIENLNYVCILLQCRNWKF